MPNDPNNSDPGQVPANQNPPGQVPNPNDPVSNGTPNQPSIDDLLKQIKELRAENASHRKKNKDAEDAAAVLEQQRLAEQGQFKELAAKHETRVKELEPVAASYTKLAEQINAQIEAEIKDWPAEVKNLVPGADIPAEQRLEQMTRLRPLLEKLQTTARGASPGNRPNPPQASPAATKQAQLEANRAAFTKQRGYSSI